MSEQQPGTAIKIGMRTFITSAVILLLLMTAAGILSRVIPPGTYERITQDSVTTIVPDSFQFTQQAPLPVWRWFTAPIEVLWSTDGAMVIVIILFLLILSASFSILNQCRVIHHLINRVVARFGHRKYLVLCGISLLFMALGSFVGLFEETLLLVPISIALALSFGWDKLTGLGMSLLSVGFGFASGVMNPFTVGVAQRLAELPLFSGIPYRLLVFVLIYAMVALFLTRHAKKVDKKASPDADAAIPSTEPENAAKLNKAVRWFGGAVVLIVVMVVVFAQTGLSDYSLPAVALLFLIGGVGGGLIAGLKGKALFKTMGRGIADVAPGILLILLAVSVKFIMSESGTIDTLMYYAADMITQAGQSVAALGMYLVVLVLNFFIGSASAKAFLVMPVLAPLADLCHITRQTAVLAFAFGDGYSNVFFPTNAVLLIGLGLAGIGYGKWFKFTWLLQLLTLVLTGGLLLLGAALALGPY
jgi:uncharacterized ion transporter superfamily protein YfcC